MFATVYPNIMVIIEAGQSLIVSVLNPTYPLQYQQSKGKESDAVVW